MERPVNDCYTCPYRKQVPGSAHSLCSIIDPSPAMMLYLMKGKIEISDENTNEKLLEIHDHGYKNGWATWPINFDPVWITCRLPIKPVKKESDGAI